VDPKEVDLCPNFDDFAALSRDTMEKSSDHGSDAGSESGSENGFFMVETDGLSETQSVQLEKESTFSEGGAYAQETTPPPPPVSVGDIEAPCPREDVGAPTLAEGAGEAAAEAVDADATPPENAEPVAPVAKELDEENLEADEAVQAAESGQPGRGEEEEEVQADRGEDVESHCPGLSQFTSSAAEDFCEDDSVFTNGEWDSISQFLAPAATAAVGSLVHKIAEIGLAAVSDSSDDANGFARGMEGLGETLERAFQGHGCGATFPAPAARPAASECAGENPQPSAPEDRCEDNPLLAELAKLLAKRHVVQAVQEFLNTDVMADVVVDMARLGLNEGISSCPRGALCHLGDLFPAVGGLLKSAPELIGLFPALLRFATSYGACASESDSSAEGSVPPVAAEVPEFPPQQAASSNAVVHKHILCDGCTTAKKKQKSRQEGNTVGAHIAGIRWKSAIIEDFDLCSTCEATGDFEESHGPFLKITDPKKAPHDLVVVLRSDQTLPGSHDGRVRDVDGNRWDRMSCNYRGTRRHQRRTFRQRPQPPPARVAQPGALSCPSGHTLTSFSAANTFTCDACGKAAFHGARMSGCRTCNWDLCQECVDAQTPSPTVAEEAEKHDEDSPQEETQQQSAQRATESGGAAPSAPLPSPFIQQQFAPHSQIERPRAKFVADISLADGALVSPGQSISKIWRISNPGAQSWPEGVRLVNVGGEIMNGPLNGVVVPPVVGNGLVDVALDLVAPNRPGRYVGYWRLMSPEPNQQRFGHRLWVDITVKTEEQPAQAAAQERAATANEAEGETDMIGLIKWNSELEILGDLGFTDVDKLIGDLEALRGNVQDVVERQLSQTEAD